MTRTCGRGDLCGERRIVSGENTSAGAPVGAHCSGHDARAGVRDVPRLALRPEEAAAALGVSRDYFDEHVASELRWVRRGRLKLVSLVEMNRWLDREAEL